MNKADREIVSIEIKEIHDKVEENYTIVTGMKDDLTQVRKFIFNHMGK